jgi:hypothetical protein
VSPNFVQFILGVPLSVFPVRRLGLGRPDLQGTPNALAADTALNSEWPSTGTNNSLAVSAQTCNYLATPSELSGQYKNLQASPTEVNARFQNVMALPTGSYAQIQQEIPTTLFHVAFLFSIFQ